MKLTAGHKLSKCPTLNKERGMLLYIGITTVAREPRLELRIRESKSLVIPISPFPNISGG